MWQRMMETRKFAGATLFADRRAGFGAGAGVRIPQNMQTTSAVGFSCTAAAVIIPRDL
jgi:hypothetical protein